MKYLELLFALPTKWQFAIISLVITLVNLIVFFIITSKKIYYNKPIWLTYALAIGEFLCVYFICIVSIEDNVSKFAKMLSELFPQQSDFSKVELFISIIIVFFLELGGLNLMFTKLQKDIEKVGNDLQNTSKIVKRIDKDVKQEWYDEKSKATIYGYYARRQRRKNEYDDKTDIPKEQINQWFDTIKGKETSTILAKILEKSNNTDGIIIQLKDNGEKRTLFITGYEYDRNCSRYLQAHANKRALQRFENMKSRGFLDGNIDRFYITLQGKEYVLEKNAIDLLPPKLDSNEQNNISEPIKQ